MRAACEYAHRHQRPVISISADPTWEATGWLGDIIGPNSLPEIAGAGITSTVAAIASLLAAIATQLPLADQEAS